MKLIFLTVLSLLLASAVIAKPQEKHSHGDLKPTNTINEHGDEVSIESSDDEKSTSNESLVKVGEVKSITLAGVYQ